MPLAVKSRIVKGFANCGYRLAALVRLLRWGVTHMQTTGFALRGKSVFTILAFAFLPLEVTAAPGGTFTNGTTSTDPPGVVIPAFLFEPEAPLQSLKTAPIWNELEQMLDNPYSVALCSALPATVDPLVRNTPGTTQIPGSPPAPVYPAYCSIAPRGRPAFGVTLPPLLVHPLNYNPTTGEEMRLLNPDYPGGTWLVPEELVQSEINPDLWSWRYRHVDVSDGSRVEQAEINYNAPFRADVASSEMFARMFANAASSGTNAGLAAATGFLDIPLLGGHCITTTEPWPSPEGAINCGGDPGEPGGTVLTLFGRVSTLPAFGVNRPDGYSRPAIPGVASTATPIAGATNIVTGLSARLFDATRGGNIPPRNAAGAGGLNKPSLRVPAFGGTPANPNYLHNTDRDDVAPSNENDFIQNRTVAAALGKAFFWDMQVGSDAVQSCGSCHAHAAADNRTKNQMNPNS